MSQNKEKWMKVAWFIDGYESCGYAFNEKLCVELGKNYCYHLCTLEQWGRDDEIDNFSEEDIRKKEEELNELTKDITYVSCDSSVISQLILKLQRRKGFSYEYLKGINCHLYGSNKGSIVINNEKDAFVFKDYTKEKIIQTIYENSKKS